MGEYTAAELLRRAGEYAALSTAASEEEARHRAAQRAVGTVAERRAASALAQVANCTARHWKRIADALRAAEHQIDEDS